MIIGVEKRKEIWKAIILIENTAMRDAELKFQNASDWKAKMNYEDEQYQKYLKKLLKHYKIDEDIKGIIMMEELCSKHFMSFHVVRFLESRIEKFLSDGNFEKLTASNDVIFQNLDIDSNEAYQFVT